MASIPAEWQGIKGLEAEFEVTEEFHWGQFAFEHKVTGKRYPVLCSVSHSHVPREGDTAFNGYCRQYAFRDTFITRRRIFEATSVAEKPDPKALSFYHNNAFGDDIATDQLLDENWGDIEEFFNRAQNEGVASSLHYQHVATSIPHQTNKDLTGCNMLKISSFATVQRLLNPHFRNQATNEIVDGGPILSFFLRYQDFMNLGKPFIYLPQTSKPFLSNGKNASHAVMITGHGKAKIKKNGAIVEYFVIQNNWGTKANPVGRMPSKLFAKMYAPLFKGQINLRQFWHAEGNATYRLVGV